MIELLAVFGFGTAWVIVIRKITRRARWLACQHDDPRLGQLGEPMTDEENRAQLNMLAREIRDGFENR